MDKVALHLGPISVHWYGVFVAAGFLAGLWTASRRGLREGLRPEAVYDIGPWLILGALVGARTLYVISYWRDEFAHQPSHIFYIHKGGLVFYGGLIGASLSVLFYLLIKKLPVWKFADTMAPSIALGSFFGRFGCLINGCCYGKSCDLPWAIHYPADYKLPPGGLHPTQLYDSLLNLALYISLAWMFRHKRFDGQVFASFLLGYAVLRAIVETFRGDYKVYYLAGVATPAQLVSMGIFVVGAVLFWRLRMLNPGAKPAK